MFKTMMLTAALALTASGSVAVAGQGPAEPRPGAPDRAAFHKARADDWALLLQLKPEQRAALDTWLQAGRPPAPPADTPDRAGPPPRDQSFEQHLARMEQRANEHASEERARLTALRTFYQSLDATQRQRFEALMRLSHGPEDRMGPPPFGHGGRHGRGPGGPVGFDGPDRR